MKTPRKPVSHLFKSKPTNHAQNLSSIPHVLGTPPRFLSNSPLIPQFRNTHELASQIPPKPTSRCYQTLTNGFFSAKLLDYMAKSKPFSANFQFDKMSNGFSQRRSISSTQSDLGSDAVPVVSTENSPFQGSTPIDAGSSIRKPISLWPGMYHSPVTNALWEARSNFFEKSSNGSENGNPHSELIVKTPSESRTSISYKFSSDYILREQYRNPWNEIRMGKLLEDLDALAGTISFKHCSSEDSSTRPLILVTASVDKMVVRKPIKVDTDLTIAGAVTWVGRSSMEIQLEVTQSSEETSDPPMQLFSQPTSHLWLVIPRLGNQP